MIKTRSWVDTYVYDLCPFRYKCFPPGFRPPGSTSSLFPGVPFRFFCTILPCLICRFFSPASSVLFKSSLSLRSPLPRDGVRWCEVRGHEHFLTTSSLLCLNCEALISACFLWPSLSIMTLVSLGLPCPSFFLPSRITLPDGDTIYLQLPKQHFLHHSMSSSIRSSAVSFLDSGMFWSTMLQALFLFFLYLLWSVFHRCLNFDL